MALETTPEFLAFAVAALLVSAVFSLIVSTLSLVFLVAQAPRQTLYALAEEVTGERTDSYVEVSFWLFYGTAFPTYVIGGVLLSLPYVWFVVHALQYPVYWLAGFPILFVGVTATLMGWFARERGLPWTRTPRLRDRVLMTAYSVLTIGGTFAVSYYAALRAITFVMMFL